MASSSPFEAIVQNLERVRGPDQRGWYTAICVFHNDQKHPNLRVNTRGFACMACGAKGSLRILAAKLGLGSEPTRLEDRIILEYDYRDASGALLFQVVKLYPKDFRQRRPDGSGGWIWDLKGIKPVLYRLPELLVAESEETVFVVEGEKDADRLAAEGLVATTSPMGAGKWKPEYAEYLRDRRVVVIPDNDEPGRQHAASIERSLTGVASAWRCLELPGLGEKGDVSDWLDAGGTVERLRSLSTTAPIQQIQEPPPVTGDGFHQTDAGNGELFARLYGDRVRFDHRRDTWLIWAGHWWQQDKDGEVRRLAKEAARQRYQDAVVISDLDQRAKESKFAIGTENRGRLDSMLLQARTEVPITDGGDGWDSNPWLLAVENGVVDLKTGELRPGRPDDRITKHTNIAFDANASCPRWLQFLDEVFQSDKELIDYIWKAVGYSLAGDISEQCVFTCYGGGANGKSVFLKLIQLMAGDYGHIAPFSTFEAQSRQSIPNDLAALAGRRLVTASETNEGVKLNEARLKALTGGEKISARFLNHEWFEFEPVGKFWLAFNHKPRVTDDSFGFWRRVRLIPFLQQFTSSADPHLVDKLRPELPGILAWAVLGCSEWQKRGLKPPASVTLATEAYRVESDPLAAFIEETCVTRADSVVGSTEAYRAYQEWASRAGMQSREMQSSTSFGRRMSARFEKQHTKTGNSYRGIGLLTDRAAAPILSEVKGLVKGFESEDQDCTSELEGKSLTRKDQQKAFTTLHPSPDATCSLCEQDVWALDDVGVSFCRQHLPQGVRL